MRARPRPIAETQEPPRPLSQDELRGVAAWAAHASRRVASRIQRDAWVRLSMCCIPIFASMPAGLVYALSHLHPLERIGVQIVRDGDSQFIAVTDDYSSLIGLKPGQRVWLEAAPGSHYAGRAGEILKLSMPSNPYGATVAIHLDDDPKRADQRFLSLVFRDTTTGWWAYYRENTMPLEQSL